MKQTLIISVVALLIGIAAGSQLFPTVKTKEVEVEKQVIVKDIITVTKVVTKPDGTTESTTTTTDKTKENKSATNTKTVAAPNWHASIAVNTDNIALNNLVYTVQVERRVLGDLFIGANVSTDKTVGLSLGASF
jgi:hypothetical protein